MWLGRGPCQIYDHIPVSTAPTHVSKGILHYIEHLVLERFRDTVNFEPGGEWQRLPDFTNLPSWGCEICRVSVLDPIRHCLNTHCSGMSCSYVLQLFFLFNVPTVHWYLVNQCNYSVWNIPDSWLENQKGDKVSGIFKDLHFFTFFGLQVQFEAQQLRLLNLRFLEWKAAF